MSTGLEPARAVEEEPGWWVPPRGLRRAGLRAACAGGPLLVLVGWNDGLRPALAAAAGVGVLHGLAALVEELGRRRPAGLGRDLAVCLLVWTLAAGSLPVGCAQLDWSRSPASGLPSLERLARLAALGALVFGPLAVATAVRTTERAGEDHAVAWYAGSGVLAASIAGALLGGGFLVLGAPAPVAAGAIVAVCTFALWVVAAPVARALLEALDALEAQVFPSAADE